MKKIVTILAIFLAVVIVVLLGFLIFIKPVQGPAISPTISTAQNLEVDLPHPGDTISSPVAIEGSVTGGGWFFEASFPIKILNSNGVVIGSGTAQALSDWMSTGTVPFSASISFIALSSSAEAAAGMNGIILFANDNPSGLPANAKSLSVPVRFAPAVGVATTTTGGAGGSMGLVQGTVVLGPTCPVERIPPDPACAPKPYKTSIAISRNIQNPEVFKTIQTDASAAFSVSLAPGEYDFQPKGGATLPRCSEQLVEVTAGETTTVTLSCDTGIR